MYNHVSLFGGLGGFIIAANRLGVHTSFANELDKGAVATLNANFPDVRVSSKDIRELSPFSIANLNVDIDILSAGFPCQSFSQAGNNLGFEDERGKLFFEIPRFIRECQKPPKVVVLENVSHLKSFDNGSRLRVVINELRKVGYWVHDNSVAILNANEFSSSPQNRERLFIVGVHSNYFKKNQFSFPVPVKAKNKCIWDFVDRKNMGPEKAYLSDGNKYEIMIRKASEKTGKDRLYQIRRVQVRACPPNVCPTLTANMGGGGHNVPFLFDEWGIRKLTVDECLSLQSIKRDELFFPDFILEKDRYSMIGNSVCVDVVEKIFEQVLSTVFERVKNEYKVALP
jgi:DNA (cytosine-5)-methyltransferase 1